MEEAKQVLPNDLQNKTNLMPGTFSSRMSGGADLRAEPLRYGFAGDSVSPGKAIFAGGKRRRTRKNTTGKRRRQHNKQQSQRKKQRR